MDANRDEEDRSSGEREPMYVRYTIGAATFYDCAVILDANVNDTITIKMEKGPPAAQPQVVDARRHQRALTPSAGAAPGARLPVHMHARVVRDGAHNRREDAAGRAHAARALC